ncbi:MAG: hypothetical protein WKG07_45670 [Hymenobacter sp.]
MPKPSASPSKPSAGRATTSPSRSRCCPTSGGCSTRWSCTSFSGCRQRWGPFVQPETRRPLGLEPPAAPAAASRPGGPRGGTGLPRSTGIYLRRRTAGPLLLREFRGAGGRAGHDGRQRPAGLLRPRPHYGPDHHRPPVQRPGGLRPGHLLRPRLRHHAPHRWAIALLPQEIPLRFAPVQGRYALSYPPLHASQVVVLANDEEIRLRLTSGRHPRPAHGTAQLRPRGGGAGPRRPARLAATAAAPGEGRAGPERRPLRQPCENIAPVNRQLRQGARKHRPRLGIRAGQLVLAIGARA